MSKPNSKPAPKPDSKPNYASKKYTKPIKLAAGTPGAAKTYAIRARVMFEDDRHLPSPVSSAVYTIEARKTKIKINHKAENLYKPDLNWLTYSCLLDFASYLKDELVVMEMNPRDMIDVQSFMWCITPGKYG